MIQSPSSISTYKQCPRKYYYQYILRLKREPNIHQIVGGIAHYVLENCFDVDLGDAQDHKTQLQKHMLTLLEKQWNHRKKEIESFNLSQSEKNYYFDEISLMLINWLSQFFDRVDK